MSYGCYPEMAITNIDWLGEIPRSWETRKLRHLFRIQKRIAGELGHDVLAITQKGIRRKDTESGEGQLSMDYSKYQIVRAGDFAMNHMDLLTGWVDISPYEGVTSPDYRVFEMIEKDAEPRYFLYLLQMGYTCRVFYAHGQGSSHLGRWRFPTENFKNFRFPLPSTAEQSAIANFLDREAAKIDDLIDKQEQLIRLLEEKRQAVISHAVTKGLDSDVRMKDSGVEWIGHVPEHWMALPIRYVARLESGHTPSRNKPEYWVDCTIPWISLADVWQIRHGTLNYIEDTNEKISRLGMDNSAARLLPRGTVILSRTASVGFSAIMATDMATTQDFANWVCGCRVLPEYLLFVFRAMKPSLGRIMIGSTHKTIYMPDIAEMKMPLPPVGDQEEIVKSVLERLATIDKSGLVASEGVTLLKERRAALISAAVTGKIDVRNAV